MSGNMKRNINQRAGRPASEWDLSPPYGVKAVLAVIILTIVLAISARHTEIDRMFYMLGEAVGNLVGVNESSQVVRGAREVGSSMWPPQISQSTAVVRIEGFDADDLPFLSYVETREVQETRVNPQTLERETTTATESVLIRPVGYLSFAFYKMLETIEIAIWATIFAIIISIPLAYFSAANYTSNRLTYSSARAIVSFFRSIPELISAMFLVLAFGFGPIAGILALGIHSAGFLGKFYAEDIENADKGPQEALKAIGASKVKILRYAVLPQVLPQYVAYNMYILDRNVRMATVIGIVGAGGIGQELKGRYDMFDYGHVATILILIFLTVFVLDQISGRIRSKLI